MVGLIILKYFSLIIYILKIPTDFVVATALLFVEIAECTGKSLAIRVQYFKVQ
jgi:hypothetical protein